MKEWWPVIAFVLTIAVVPALKWVVGQLRKGLASHEDLEMHTRSAAEAQLALERRLVDRLEAQTRWIADHNTLHATIAADLTHLRQTMAELPKADQLARVLLAVEGVRGDLKAISATMEGVRTTIDQIDARVLRHEGIFADAAAARRAS
ncbi:hypothetical protein HL658_31300 [Azospirillum sp. RWY-5-1]|uniref:DUF2730 domain-containing protein n=1 Tax=Azospirillum oleiclasticum TaxID=2735135 RepID=A0ABX2TK39_9PROT|nr:hypothetical protein [Azospirillum oleiclasticum]NYZ17052.1 hypothetical protein [Azospirillum oleiclasticum]NYZ24504.1 hypothetical protein [Azospirillum oleiclasticum]